MVRRLRPERIRVHASRLGVVCVCVYPAFITNYCWLLARAPRTKTTIRSTCRHLACHPQGQVGTFDDTGPHTYIHGTMTPGKQGAQAMTMPPPRPNKLRPVPTGKPRCGDSVAAAEPRLKRKSSPKNCRMLEDTSRRAYGPRPCCAAQTWPAQPACTSRVLLHTRVLYRGACAATGGLGFGSAQRVRHTRNVQRPRHTACPLRAVSKGGQRSRKPASIPPLGLLSSRPCPCGMRGLAATHSPCG
jgi:hypothetical protein